MKVLFESAFNINRNINKLVNQDAINSFGKTLYQGDNANYSISLFQNYLIEPNEKVKIFLQHLGQPLYIGQKIILKMVILEWLMFITVQNYFSAFYQDTLTFFQMIKMQKI